MNVFPGWNSGLIPATGSGDAMLSSPLGLTGNGTDLLVADTSNHRMARINIASGNFTGWMGQASIVPTGGATDCNRILSGMLTPGWCMGGTATSGAINGAMNSPSDIWVDGNDFYVVDSLNHRLVRFVAK